MSQPSAVVQLGSARVGTAVSGDAVDDLLNAYASEGGADPEVLLVAVPQGSGDALMDYLSFWLNGDD